MGSVVHPPRISFRVWKITVFGRCTVSYTYADQISTCETLTPPIFMFLKCTRETSDRRWPSVFTAHSIFTPSLEFGLSMAIVCPILNRQGHGVMQRDVMTWKKEVSLHSQSQIRCCQHLQLLLQYEYEVGRLFFIVYSCKCGQVQFPMIHCKFIRTFHTFSRSIAVRFRQMREKYINIRRER